MAKTEKIQEYLKSKLILSYYKVSLMIGLWRVIKQTPINKLAMLFLLFSVKY